jgi:hypothetical protein
MTGKYPLIDRNEKFYSLGSNSKQQAAGNSMFPHVNFTLLIAGWCLIRFFQVQASLSVRFILVCFCF